MKRVLYAALLVVGLTAPAVARDVTTQIKVACNCQQLYPAWMCEAFGFFLC